MIEKNIRLEPHHSRDLLVGRRSDGRRPGYQPPGGGATSLGSGRDVGGGGGGGGDRPSPHRDPAPARVEPKVSPVQSMAMTGGTGLTGMTQTQAANVMEASAAVNRDQTGGTTLLESDINLPDRPAMLGDYGLGVVDTSRPSMLGDTGGEFTTRGVGPAPLDIGFQNILREQKIAEDLRQKQQDPNYGQFFRPQPVVEKPKSGIGGALKTAGKGILEMALMPFLPKPVRTAWQAKKRYDALQKSAIGEKLNLKELDFSNLTSNIDRAAKLRSRPKGMPEHLGETGFRTRDDTPPRDGDGIQTAITGETGLLTEGAETLGITEDQRKQYILMQNKMKTALDQGSYTNEQGQVIQLNEQQLDQLQNYIDRLNNILGTVLHTDPMPTGAAHGGRIDSPLMGGNRYI